MVLTVETGDRPVAERFDYWRHVVSETFVPLRCDPADASDPATFQGRISSATLGALQVTEVAATPHLVDRSRKLISEASDDYLKFVVQLNGECLLTQGGREAFLRPGDLAIYDTLRPYSMRLDRPYRILVLLIPRQRLLVPATRLAELVARSIPGDRGVGALLASMLRELVSRLDEFDPISGVRVADNVLDLVNTLFAPGESGGSRVTLPRVKTYIEQHLADPDLGPESVAASHFISTRYLHKLFRQEGDTVAGWIRTRRLARCRRDLRDPLLLARPVSAVGARWGLPDPAHFSRVFRARYGLSPREYRNEVRRMSAGGVVLGLDLDQHGETAFHDR